MSGPVTERPYLSIGEVLGLLLEEFPDVTISKIRFLESQGLIDPERTPSGYRKFYDGDVDRLRTILREQKENFLPLKVIRDRLERGDIESEGAQPTPPRGIRNVTQLPTATAAAPGAPVGDSREHVSETTSARHHPSAQLRLADTPAPERARTGTAGQVDEPSGDLGAESGGTPDPPVAADLITPSTPASAAPSVSAAASERSTAEPAAPAELRGRPEISSRDSYSAAEVCSLAGITPEQLAEIEEFGLVSGRGSGPATSYVGTDVAIAEAAAGFLRRGVEGRHLRAWRQAAERESALFEQLILPHLRQRNPQARRQAAATLEELCRLGGELRRAILASALRQHLDG